MEAEVRVQNVSTVQTRSGNTRYVVRDGDDNEYTTFREQIGAAARALEGSRARITYHEQQRGQYTNVYLDAIEPLEDDEEDGEEDDPVPEEVAWRTAVEAAPWLIGTSSPKQEVPPDQLFEKLKPFKDRVTEDIREDEATEAEEDDEGSDKGGSGRK